MEFLDIVDEFGNPTGETVSREKAHKKGIRHRTSHLWLYSVHDGKIFVLAQKRSQNKDSYPGCFDISSAGHIPAGFDFVESALRECSEELGVSLSAEDLTFIGQRKFEYTREFHGAPFHDNQISNVYIAKVDYNTVFTPQESELECAKWFEFSDLCDSVRNNLIPNCIREEELCMMEKFFGGADFEKNSKE